MHHDSDCTLKLYLFIIYLVDNFRVASIQLWRFHGRVFCCTSCYPCSKTGTCSSSYHRATTFFPVKHSPPQLSQVSLQHTKAPKKCFQLHQQAVFDTRKHTQNLEQQQRTPYPAGVPPSSQMVGSEECDWSGHSCPDGFTSERFLILASQS
uniref:Uncharacterized protein n=1 Tax=Salix viminalis TaxID=40686 RepID=A0A6N2NCE0_SALVM